MNFQIFFSLMTGLCLGTIFLNIPPGLTVLMNLYGVTYTGISVLLSALLWSHALLQIPAGMVTDKLGIKRTLILGLAFMSLSSLLPAVRTELIFAILCRVIAGIGTSLCFVAVMKLVAVYAPGGRIGTYQSFFAAFFSIGNILSFLIIPKLLPFGWQWIYLVPGMLSLVLLIVSFSLRLRPQPPVSASGVSIMHIFQLRAGWVLGFYHALSWGALISLGNWAPTLLSEFWPESTLRQLAWGAALVMFVCGLGRTSGGFLLLRIPSLFIANSSIVILTILFLGLFWVHIPVLLLILALLTAWFSSVNFGAFFDLASGIVESESLATMFGFLNFLANMGAVLLTLVFGLVKDHTGSLSWGFGSMAFLSLIVFLFGNGVLKRDCSSGSCHLDL
ncbi:MAG: MFS transporter [Deltaproteobacteria bacterium]|nr:MFS transporter [Deltaproteobacteria bacterium]